MAEEQKKYTLSNFTIRDVQKADGIKEETGKPWLRFKFKTTDPQAKDREFTYFPYGGLTHPEKWPYDGVKVISMTFTITEEGKYAGDCTVKTLTFDPASKPPPAEESPFGEEPSQASSGAPSETIPPKSETIGGLSETITVSQGTCISYVKDMAIARLAWVNHDKIQPLEEMANNVARVGAQFYRDVINNLKRMEE